MTTKIMTIRVPVALYATLCAQAAELGVPVAAHTRRLIESEHQANQLEQLRAELLDKLDRLTAPAAAGPDEILLLLRAIAAHTNPRLVAQVRAQINANQQARGTAS